jgi:ribosomal protein S18 acetylase RimI-like enzyme
MEIRAAHPNEHAALGEICLRAYRNLGSVSDGYAAELRDVAGRAETDHVLTAVNRDGLLGCVTVILGDSPWREISGPDEGELRMLAVDPAAQGRGVGTALLRRVLDASRGRDGVVCSSLPEMGAAHRIYRRLGFRRVPERDWSPVPGVRLLAFAVALG